MRSADFVMSIDPTRLDVSLQYVLELEILGAVAGGRLQIRYRLFCNELLLFDSNDATIPAGYDLHKAAIDLLGFLSLGVGDTDEEFFSGYTDMQKRWRDLYAEDLACASCGEDT